MTTEQEIEILLEAARRANWEAMHGPQHLRSGRFFITKAHYAHYFDGQVKPTPASGDGSDAE